MHRKALFTENQKFSQTWLLIILSVITALLVYGAYAQINLGVQFGITQISNEALLVLAILMVAFTLFMFLVQLQIRIDQEKLAMRYFPIQFRYKNHYWRDIETVELMDHVPHRDFTYAPHRLRWLSGNSTYLIYGSKAYKLHFVDGRKLLISTKKFEELKSVMQQIDVSTTISANPLQQRKL
ncbi:MAG: hypothetical protein Q4F57_01050 [Weeksellaceae bacterium]|nr:hypothetical protein [Weeksellaceae bacterium]